MDKACQGNSQISGVDHQVEIPVTGWRFDTLPGNLPNLPHLES